MWFDQAALDAMLEKAAGTVCRRKGHPNASGRE